MMTWWETMMSMGSLRVGVLREIWEVLVGICDPVISITLHLRPRTSAVGKSTPLTSINTTQQLLCNGAHINRTI